MKKNLIALAIMASATSGMVHAQLNSVEQGKALIESNQDRTAQQHKALQDAYRTEFNRLKSEKNATEEAAREALAHQQNPIDYRRDVSTAVEITAEKQQRESAVNDTLNGAKLQAANANRVQPQIDALRQAEVDKQIAENNTFAEVNNNLNGAKLQVANANRVQPQIDALRQAEVDKQIAENNAFADANAKLNGAKLQATNANRVQPQIDALHQAEVDKQVAENNAFAEVNNNLNGAKLQVANANRVQPQIDALHQAEVDKQIAENNAAVEAIKKQTGIKLQSANSTRVQSQTNALTAATSQSVVEHNVASNTAAIVQNDAQAKTLATQVTVAQNTGTYAQSRADAAYANSETNRQALQATNHRLADNTAELANHEQRIDKLESSNNANFGKLKNQVDDNRQRASAAISGVAAMANIPQVIQGQTFSVGAGVGTTDGESALAVGFSARAAEHVVVKASVSDDTQQNFVVGGGVSYGW